MNNAAKLSLCASVLCLVASSFVFTSQAQASTCITPPASCRVTSKFGNRLHPVQKKWKLHRGTDYGCGIGTPLISVENGAVVRASFDTGGGNFVVLRGTSGREFKYLHLSRFSDAAARMQPLTRGLVVGNSGNTGKWTTGPHLHFEAWSGGTPIDPQSLMCTGDEQPPAEDVGDTPHDNPAEGSDEPEVHQPELGDGSLFSMIENIVGAKALNPDYPAQLAKLGKERLYSELAYLDAASLRVNAEKRASLERIEVMKALRQILMVEANLKHELSKAKANAMRK